MTDKKIIIEKDIYTLTKADLVEQLISKTQECEELLKENQQLRNSLSDSLMFKFTGQENETNRYRKALEEIEEYIYNNTDFDVNDSIQSKTSGYDILQIIKDV